jgi:secreted PhoX family phosphatase
MNHEYIDNGMLFTDGTANWSLDKARKGQNAMGVSVVEVKKSGSDWQVVRPSSYARRITVNTPMQLTGPARHQDLMKTAADPQGSACWAPCRTAPTAIRHGAPISPARRTGRIFLSKNRSQPAGKTLRDQRQR